VLTPSRNVQVHLAVEPVDFRNAIDGLCGMIRNRLDGDPLAGHVWVFHNRKRTALKLIFWDQGGYVLVHKRLAKGRFRVPQVTGARLRLTHAELIALLEGIDLSRARRLPRWNPPETGVKAL
jgi:transposase